MKKFFTTIFILILFFPPIYGNAQLPSPIQIYFFHTEDCQPCQVILQSYLPTLKTMFPGLEVKTFNVGNPDHYEALSKLEKKFGPTGNELPIVFGLLGWMFRTKKVRPFPIFLDSPMAIEATKICERHPDLFDDEMTRFIRERPLNEDLKTLKACVTSQQSREINDQAGPCLVMAGAGMCNAGRILHHLKASLWKPDTHVLIVGYQGNGSLGRQLVDGADSVRIHGATVAVKARVHTVGGFSAHAGQSDLLTWFSARAARKPRVILTHGEDGPRQALAKRIQQRFRLDCTLPQMKDVIEV